MNELTRVLVIKTARNRKAAAKKNDADFREYVRIAHWDYMLDIFGVDLKKRAMSLMESFRPEFFDSDGYIKPAVDRKIILDLVLSRIAVRVLRRKIARTPHLKLSYDWGNLPVVTAEPQLKLF